MNPLSRRTLLRGTGVAMSLPFLDAMMPKSSKAAETAGAMNKRVGFIFFPNGAIMDKWNPTGGETDFKFNQSMKSLSRLRQDVLLVQGLAHDKARANGDGAGDHARCSATYLTGVQAKKTGGADIHLGTSIDQVIAEKVGQDTRLPSLELGLEPGRQAGICDSGYSCAYQGTISWKGPSQPMPKEIVPRLAFERLFGKPEDNERNKKRDHYRKSILDMVSADAQTVAKKLGQTDRRKLDEYYSSIRDIEVRIDKNAKSTQIEIPTLETPSGIPEDYIEHIRLMYDIMHLAYQTDTTRVVSLMLANSGSNRRYTHVGVREGHHEISHHRNNEEKVALIQKIDEFLVDEFARFLDKMKQTVEGPKTMLDNSIIVYGCSISDGNRHRHEELPVIIAGKGGGSIKTGRSIHVGKEVPMSNLFMSIAENTGVKLPRFGDSTGTCPKLT
jgi:hypothetical protein